MLYTNEPMRDTYMSLRCVIPAELEEKLPELLVPWEILGTEIGGISGGGVMIAVYLSDPASADVDGLCSLLTTHGARDIEREFLDVADWLAEFRESVRPFEVGRCWWIDPHPDQPTAAPSGRQRLVVEPRMAFGTGSHESTQAILMALEDIEVNRRRVLDVGTGSGILALAAECKGADSVIGLDIDETAVWVALETAQQQEWRSRVSFVVGPVACFDGAEFDIVMCNMITSSFLPLAGQLKKMLAPAGTAVFSGLLASEVGIVSTALVEAGFTIPSHRIHGDWASLVAVSVTHP